MKIHDQNFAIGSPITNIHEKKNKQGFVEYLRGEYHYGNGSVSIYQQGYFGDTKHVSLSIYRNGRGYYRTIHGKIYTHIGLARKAGEFARHIDKEFPIKIQP